MTNGFWDVGRLPFYGILHSLKSVLVFAKMAFLNSDNSLNCNDCCTGCHKMPVNNGWVSNIDQKESFHIFNSLIRNGIWEISKLKRPNRITFRLFNQTGVSLKIYIVHCYSYIFFNFWNVVFKAYIYIFIDNRKIRRNTLKKHFSC